MSLFGRLRRVAWWRWDDATIDRAMPLLLSGDVAGLIAFADSREVARQRVADTPHPGPGTCRSGTPTL